MASIASRQAAYGYGLSVIGRKSATRRSLPAATSSIAVLQMRAIVPNATSSKSYGCVGVVAVPTAARARSISSYFSLRWTLCWCSASGDRNSELTMRRGRPCRPVSAQVVVL